MNTLKVGTITLKKAYEFTQYSECAAWTDYVACEPQTVELRYVDNYWLCAHFAGKLSQTTFPNRDGWRKIGQDQNAAFQTQAFGVNPDTDLFHCEITNPDWTIKQVSEYSDGRPMFALQRIAKATQP